MKYLILITLILVACGTSTTDTESCKEYETSYLLIKKEAENLSQRTYVYYSDIDQCEYAGEGINTDVYHWQCVINVDNTGCN